MLGGGSRHRCVVILTAIRVEYEAVLAHLTDLHEVTYKGTVYERGTFLSRNRSWEVIIGEIGPRNSNTAMETERAIDHFKPDIAFFVGIAGGLKDVSFGDVVVATQAYSYISGKANKGNLELRPVIGLSAHNLVQRARAVARKEDWLLRIKGAGSIPSVPHVFVGSIASGDRVIASTLSSDWKILRTKYSDALAVDMEGYGFLEAAHTNKVDALVVRGISDLVDDKNDDFHDTAARHAAAFTFEVLAKFDISETAHEEPVTWQSLAGKYQSFLGQRNFQEALKILLGCRRQINDMQIILHHYKRNSLDVTEDVINSLQEKLEDIDKKIVLLQNKYDITNLLDSAHKAEAIIDEALIMVSDILQDRSTTGEQTSHGKQYSDILSEFIKLFRNEDS